MLKRLAWAAALALCGCTEAPQAGSKVLVMGDSLLAVNGLTGQSVAAGLERELHAPVTDRAVLGAGFLYPLPLSGAAGMKISAQYVAGAWDWVVLNGGGNDVLTRCGCGPCGALVERLISADGRRGAIPAEVARLRATGARVVYVGYLRSNGFDSPVDKCAATGDEMDRRAARMAAADAGVVFVPLADLVPSGDTRFYASDRIHPSPMGSAAIAARIARVLRRAAP